jgi:hypothetical protein
MVCSAYTANLAEVPGQSLPLQDLLLIEMEDPEDITLVLMRVCQACFPTSRAWVDLSPPTTDRDGHGLHASTTNTSMYRLMSNQTCRPASPR